MCEHDNNIMLLQNIQINDCKLTPDGSAAHVAMAQSSRFVLSHMEFTIPQNEGCRLRAVVDGLASTHKASGSCDWGETLRMNTFCIFFFTK